MRKPSPPRDIPPPLELECLKALWALEEGTVAQVRQSLAGRRSLAYTTVMTVLERLVRKGAASRRKAGRSFVYAPVLSREVLRRLAVQELIDSLFGGSEAQLLAYLQQRLPEPEPARAAAVSAREPGLDTALL